MPQKLSIECSSISLPEDGPLQRHARHPRRTRPQDFYRSFDARQLLYDVFWDHEGKRILAVGPAPRNLKVHLARARWLAMPSGQQLTVTIHASISTMVVEMNGAPQGTSELQLQMDDMNWTVPVSENLQSRTAGSKILFTMNKNNDLVWIREWAEWHVKLHGTDTIFIFDNGSNLYDLEDIETVLEGVSGLTRYGVIDFRHKFGPIDPAVKIDPYWARFAQISSMNIVLRRLGRHAKGLLNLDIDELANAPEGRSLYDVVEHVGEGLLILPGRWVEPNKTSDGTGTGILSHSAFSLIHKDPKEGDSSPVKWILDPKRDWVDKLNVHPYWHWVRGRPLFGKSLMPEALFWHFRGINTGWKTNSRSKPRHPDTELTVDQELVKVRNRLDTLL